MSTPWGRALLPCAAALGLALGALGFGWRRAEDIAPWLSAAHVGGYAFSAAGLVLAALLAKRTYAQHRDARLALLAILLLPLAPLHFLYLANVPPKVPLPPTASLEVAPIGQEPPSKDVRPARPRRFVGLPDAVAKQHPELAERLRGLTREAYTLSLAVLPLLVLAGTLLPLPASGPGLRRLVLLALPLELLAAGCARVLAPSPLAAVPGIAGLVLLTYALGTACALRAARRSTAAGGAAAGAALLVYALPAALLCVGWQPSDLALDLKHVPPGALRVHLLGLPWVFAALVAREWVVSMKHATHTDALTQVFNKAYAEAIVNQTGGRPLGATYSVALLDIDHFKKVNDTYGHGAGDEVLREVARTIKQTIANRGLVCRTGGEEITIFFPGLDVEAARGICEEVREAVAALSVRTSDNRGKKVTLKVTVSVGVATNRDLESGRPRHPGVRTVVEAADRAVYAAKSSGRNRVVLD